MTTVRVLPLVRLKLVYESDTLCDDRPVVLGDTANREAVKREVERRVKERMILSRNRNYSRLVTASP